MTNKPAITLRNIGIIATMVLVSVVLLKFYIASAPSSAVTAGEDQNAVSPVSQIAGNLRGDSANLTGTFQALSDSNGNTDTVSGGQSSTSVIVLPSLAKVLQDEVNISGAEEAEIFCAKNEYEAFQIIVVNPTNTPIFRVDLKTGNWHFTGTPGEGAPKLTLYREHYVKIDRPSKDLKSKPGMYPGMYPDALIPFIDPYTGKEITSGKYLAKNQDVRPHKSQGYWVDVHVGSNVKAGIYTNEIEVLAGGQVIKRIPVKLTIWDFTLPKQRKFITRMYGFYNIAQYYGSPKGEAYRTLYDRYRDMVYEHGIYPAVQLGGAHYTTRAEAAKEGKPAGTVTFSPLYYSNMRTFISEYGTGIIFIPPSWLLRNNVVPSENSTPTKTEIKRTLQCYNDMAKAHPEHGQYVAYLDEPWTKDKKDSVKAVKDIMNEIPDLKIKMLLTGSQYAFDILDSAGNRCADIWVCYGQSVINDHERSPIIRRSLEDLTKDFLDDPTGKILWTNSTKGFIDANLSAYLDFAWYGYTLGATGGFNWRATLPWTAGVDAWVESRTYTNPRAPERIYNGAYFLIYPGNPDRVGISGVGGPIASMRLKIWRKACEDFEYFKMLEGLTNKATVDKIISNVVHGYYTCANPEDYAAARKTIAELILKNLKNN
jgi:hypothetical protein